MKRSEPITIDLLTRLNACYVLPTSSSEQKELVRRLTQDGPVTLVDAVLNVGVPLTDVAWLIVRLSPQTAVDWVLWCVNSATSELIMKVIKEDEATGSNETPERALLEYSDVWRSCALHRWREWLFNKCACVDPKVQRAKIREAFEQLDKRHALMMLPQERRHVQAFSIWQANVNTLYLVSAVVRHLNDFGDDSSCPQMIGHSCLLDLHFSSVLHLLLGAGVHPGEFGAYYRTLLVGLLQPEEG